MLTERLRVILSGNPLDTKLRDSILKSAATMLGREVTSDELMVRSLSKANHTTCYLIDIWALLERVLELRELYFVISASNSLDVHALADAFAG